MVVSLAKRATIAFFASLAVVSAKKIHYKVVSHVPADHSVGVMVDNQVFPLKAQKESSLYFSGKASIAETSYKYVILDGENRVIEQENFTRTPVTDHDTYNEYYNRSWNSMDLAQLPNTFEPLPIINRIKSDLHIDGQIPTIHITADQADFDYIHSNPSNKTKISGHMTYISLTDVKVFKKLSIAISGHSTRAAPKLSYKITIDKSDKKLYHNRKFKLRAMPNDPTYMKEELAYDIAYKMGLPMSKNSYVRVYFNDQPVGLFGLIENLKNPWPRNLFNNGEKYNQGALYVADVNLGGSVDNLHINFTDLLTSNTVRPTKSFRLLSGTVVPGNTSDLTYLGDNATLYEAPYSLKEKSRVGSADYNRIMELTRFISQQPNDTMVDDTYAEDWEKVLDVESALRVLAHEILVSNLDGYIVGGNNYVLYDDLKNERIVMSGQDFDISMGLLADEPFITGNYQRLFGFNKRPLTTTLLKVPKYRQRFEEILYTASVNLLSPNVLYPRIDSLSAMLRQDVEWDKSLPRVANTKSALDYTSAIPFSVAVNGSASDIVSANNSTFATLMSKLGIKSLFLKEWAQVRNENLLNFFSGTSSNNS